ncbi:uncharacterized protein EV420DRAFT_1622731 [Desarmillaria tabescens]|uniref:Uncharacterized protein n=1 Tax=Armillaria tabescens TaxID=1929756 RepID=A0AA39JNF0_ARMTA|nr:uncharacterized protein EV420DRAFT_1622731 [Desarmillaria tabescens]KAK0444519.1 hypothetical protein EV420DRAFT_1622731 [Desarmillaria tabescens]
MLITAAFHLQPPHSKKKPCLPYTADTIKCLLHHLNLSLPLDAAVCDRNNLEQTVFFIPKTKTSANGEDVFWAIQSGLTDSDHLLQNHFFSAFLARLHKAFKQAKINPLQGHGIRIRSTLEYLLCGTPFDIIKTIGRWKTDAFLLYLRKHT